MNYIQPENLLLRSLPAEIWRAVMDKSELVQLDLHESVIKPNIAMTFVDFPESGVMSILQPMADGELIEVANIGNEGMLGVTALFDGFEIGQTAFCQVEGKSYRIEIVSFVELLKKYPLFRAVCERYSVVLLDQLARNSGCFRTHQVDRRCARWLLSTHDRCHRKTFVLTQEFLSLMLGVSRTGVNQAAGALARAGLISYVRGKVIILDRKGLEQASCICYSQMSGYYEKIMSIKINSDIPDIFDVAKDSRITELLKHS
jgi:CRP-like cAMP-binding protein